MTNIIFADAEGDDFLEGLSRLWTIQLARSVDDPVEVFTDVPYEFYECLGIDRLPVLADGLRVLHEADKIAFHNGLRYDFWAIEKLFKGTLKREQIIDTLTISRLIDAESKRHSLAELGEAVGLPKITHEWGFKEFHPDMIPYGKRDVEVLQRAWKGVPNKVHSFGGFYHKFTKACELEFHTQFILAKQEQHGFRFDVQGALELETELRVEYRQKELEVRDIFPPIVHERYSEKRVDKITGKPVRLKDEIEVFNPNSNEHIADRLIKKYGWEPIDLTPTGKAKVDEDILGKLPYPEAQTIARAKRLTKMLGQLSDGDNGWLKLVTDKGYVHGAVNPLGARTHRMAHFKPNMAQVDKDPRMRSLWLPDEGQIQVGVDAKGLELRMLAHYLARYDGGAYAGYVHTGDPHEVNRVAAELFLRDSAKTIIYALLYGSGDRNLGRIVLEDLKKAGEKVPKVSLTKLGKAVRAKLEANIAGFKDLTAQCKAFHAKRGVLPGLDGRWISSNSDHSALNTLLQGNGAIVMKQAQIFFDEYTLGLQAEGKFGWLATVHDEWQTTADTTVAEEVRELGKKAITQAGIALGVRCPLEGSGAMGYNWAETH